MAARTFPRLPGWPGTLDIALGRALFDLVPPAAWLVHHRRGGAVRRPLLVRCAPVGRPPQGIGSKPGRKGGQPGGRELASILPFMQMGSERIAMEGEDHAPGNYRP